MKKTTYIPSSIQYISDYKIIFFRLPMNVMLFAILALFVFKIEMYTCQS